MDKRSIIQEIQTGLVEELRCISEDPNPSDQKRERAAEIQRQLVVFRFFPVRAFNSNEPACPGALLELELEGTRSYCLVVPQVGGLVARVHGIPVQIVTPESPIGEALMGHHAGDLIEVATRTGSRRYRLVSVS